MRRSYTELMKLPTYSQRLEYLQTGQHPGFVTFGSNRRLNQDLYTSSEWKRTRNRVIMRDCGNDMGLESLPIPGKAIVHHINPITEDDILDRSESLFDMDNLILVSMDTHNLIHYGGSPEEYVERKPNDTCPWK